VSIGRAAVLRLALPHAEFVRTMLSDPDQAERWLTDSTAPANGHRHEVDELEALGAGWLRAALGWKDPSPESLEGVFLGLEGGLEAPRGQAGV
jgi:hypothetical protein